MHQDDQWWTELYDELLADVLLERGEEDVRATVSAIADLLELGRGARVFDQCCGVGSLAIPLAARGYQVVGCDLGRGYAARGMGRARAMGLDVTLVQADAFEFVARPACDGAFNWWTGFGYADTDEKNTQMLARAFESLKPSAAFALDFVNTPGVIARFERDVVTRRETNRGTVVLLRESEIDVRSFVMKKRWSYFLPDARRIVRESRVRLYTAREIESLLLHVGFEEVDFYGSLDGSALTIDSPRCIAVARRP